MRVWSNLLRMLFDAPSARIVLFTVLVACSPSASPEEPRPEPAPPVPSVCGGHDAAPCASSEPSAAVPAPAPTAAASASAAATVAASSEPPPPGFKPIPPKRKGAFPGVAFKTVRAFAFDLEVSGAPVCTGPLNQDGTLCRTVARPGVPLSEGQVKELLSIVSSKATFGSGSKCFLPHHGFVFYDEAGTPVAELSVCLMCRMTEAMPGLSAAPASGEGSSLYGMSEKGTERLRGLCKELGLAHCDAKSPQDFGAGLPKPL